MPRPECPHCLSPETARSRRSGFYEAALLRFSGRAPFRCFRCRQRFIGRWRGNASARATAATVAAMAVASLLTMSLLVTAFFAFGGAESLAALFDWLTPAISSPGEY